MTRAAFAILCCLSLGVFAPHVAAAQGYSGVMQPQQNYRPPAGTVTTPPSGVDSNGAPIEDNSSRIDHGYGTNERSYDQLLQSTDPNRGKTSATELQEKIRQKREEMARAMKANSDRLIEKQKQRAFEQSHPGKKYTGDGTNNPDGYVDDGSANYQTGNDTTADDGPADVGPSDGGGVNADGGGDGADVGGGGMDGDAGGDAGGADTGE